MSRRPQIRGDELDLYAEFHFELVDKIGRRVNTSHENVEDACAYAWLQFFKLQPSRESEWKGWLFRVAQREAFRLDALERREAENVDQDGRAVELPDPHDRQAERDELIAAIQELRRLPPRLQRLVLLRSQVDTQQDLAKHEGLSPGRVSFLLAKVERLVDQRAQRQETRAPRPRGGPRRLREPEDDPPEWLTNAIGPRPG